LDAQALYLAAVLGVRARLFDKTLGLMGGFALLTAVNLARIVTLYLVGVRAPRLFHVLHEEILQIGLVLCALLTFGLWARWAHARFTCAT
jgi:exosortase/archaeosortase family protein